MLSHVLPKEKKLVVVIASYNNAPWYKRNLDSVLNQAYNNFRAIYIDDCSPDNTGKLVEQYLLNHPRGNKVTLIRNSERIGATGNRYKGSHLCKDNEIVLILDGDDWLAHDRVLQMINHAYQDSKTWLTYGQYRRYPTKEYGHCKALPTDFDYRASVGFYTSHLRTYYAWLFKKISRDDLMYNGEFYQIAGDVAEMIPMLEMARGHCKYLKKVLYIYNVKNPLNDFKTAYQQQLEMHAHICKQTRVYQPHII